MNIDLSDIIFSADSYFKCGLSPLLSGAFMNQGYCVVDVETTNYQQVTDCLFVGGKVLAFISNDMDYHALKHLDNVTLIDRHSPIKEVLSCLRTGDSHCHYHVKFKLSGRENIILGYMQRGVSSEEISRRLGMSMKTFYAYRTRIMNKMQITNRIFLYTSIARNQATK